MIANPLGLALDPDRSIRDQIHEAARLGARGVVLEAAGDLAPHRLGETARRELKHLLRSTELALVAMVLPTRRPLDSTDQLDERIRRADATFALAHELGTPLVLVRAGAAPAKDDEPRLELFTTAIRLLAARADHRGARLALETGSEPVLRLNEFLTEEANPFLGASLDPAGLLLAGLDPIEAARQFGPRLLHAYASDAVGRARTLVSNPRGSGFPSGALDWEEYVGALEEIGYRGFLTVRPDPGRDPAAQFAQIVSRIQQIG